MKKYLIGIAFFCIFLSGYSQDGLRYNIDAFGSLATGSNTPFWIVNNTYGMVPLKANNGYIRGGAFYGKDLNENFNFEFGVDVTAEARHSSSFFLQQLYGEMSFQALSLSVGAKEYYNSMLDKELSSGDFNYSLNARPIPEINLGVCSFTSVPFTKNILKFRGDFAVGKSTDNDYTIRTKGSGEDYATDILWHHKSLFFLVGDPTHKFPFSVLLGMEHAVQWGGWTSESNTGDIPHSFRDFIRVVLGEGGGDDSTAGDQVNALGNHQGTYNLKFMYENSDFKIGLYKQHFFDDGSGMDYTNWRDGIWGMEGQFSKFPYLQRFVLEYVNTTNQSGPMHNLYYERPGRGGGNDDYYNHDYYISGWSHWGRALGNPLLTSPEYNNDGKLYFKNNRIKAIHLGLTGKVSNNLSYRVLATTVNAWGRMMYPFLEKRDDFSALVECKYTHPRYKGWSLTGQFAFDAGSMYDDTWGCSLKVTKSGVIGL